MSETKIRNGFRRGQMIVPFGVGSIADLPDESVMMASFDLWEDNVIGQADIQLQELRLQELLDVERLYQPPSEEQVPMGVPFVRFPKWLFCRKCRKFKPVSDWREEWESSGQYEDWDIPACPDCSHREKISLVPSRFIVACPNGHVDDFPWVEWAHHPQDPCEIPDLKRTTKGESTGLQSVIIKCENCGQSNSMANTFNSSFFEDHFEEFDCRGRKPWQEIDAQSPVLEDCDVTPRTVQRGGSNVYFPVLVSAITIPPYSDTLFTEVQNARAWQAMNEEIYENSEMRDQMLKQLVEQTSFNKDRILQVMEAHFEDTQEEGDQRKPRQFSYRYDEYMAFLGRADTQYTDSRDFDVEDPISGEVYDGISGVDEVVLCNRLREVKALKEFTRLQPVDRRSMGVEDEDSLEVQSQEVTEKDRYPAIEVRGEGIFFKLDLDLIDEWKTNDGVIERAERLNDNYTRMARKRGRLDREVYPEYVLLHTLSHLLIRQLSFQCGYPSASLKERIYCHEEEDDEKIAGVLIYTAAGDSGGTLGGLVRQGRPDYFPNTFRKALSKAEWCSSDPVCIESKGQGTDSLNLAACHACGLLPETSCEEFNVLLDRGFLIGTPDNPEIGFFNN